MAQRQALRVLGGSLLTIAVLATVSTTLTGAGPAGAAPEGVSASGGVVAPDVVNGRPRQPGEVAAIVRLTVSDGSRTFNCGGTLVDLTHVVTAAHCVVDDSQAVYSPSNFTVSWSTAAAAPTDSASPVVRVYKHPSYNSATDENDVAVLELARPISGASPMPIADAETSADLLEEYAPVHIAGYGTVASGGPASGTILVGDLKVIPDSVCADGSRSTVIDGLQVWGLGANPSIVVCAMGVRAGALVDSCQGDSGGPLYSDDVLLGVVSYGYGCAGVDNGAPMAQPTAGGYVRLSAYLGWLDSVGVDITMEETGTGAVTNLKASEVKTNDKGRRYVDITWDAPRGEEDDVEEYKILSNNDWRPQRWTMLETERTRVRLSGLPRGRTYTVFVQADVGDGYGVPTAVNVEVPGDSDVGWVVSLGDSFISGEGGRWAGNTDFLPNARAETDTGERAYFDHEDGETIEGCHRSNSALIHIGVARSMNFACSGAITTSAVDKGYWKPGVDRVVRNDINLGDFGPAIGQAEMLKRFAETHRVKMVVLSIGGNNFFFSDIVTTCVESFLSGGNCSDSDRLNAYVSETWQDRVRSEVMTAIQEIVWAMRDAGYDESQWTLVQNLYPAPIARSEDMRYDESDFPIPFYRQARGGCGMRNVDADWAVGTVLPTINETVMEAALEAKIWAPDLRVVHMDNSQAFKGHELCNKAVFRLNSSNAEDRKGVKDWRRPGASDKSEWMKEIDISNLSAAEKNESFHPGYWGQLALRNCLRQLWNGGDITSGGKCTPLTGTNVRGEPNMSFVKDPSLSLLN